MPLDATPGGAESNSYETRQNADLYLGSMLNFSKWSDGSLTNTQKESALVEATMLLEKLSYRGSKASATQRLKLPRVGIRNEDGTDYESSTEVPRVLREACCELAYVLAQTPDATASSLAAFSRVELPGIKIEMKETEETTSEIPANIRRKIARFRSGFGARRLVRA